MKMKTKALLSVMLCIAVSCSLFVGCGDNTPPAQVDPTAYEWTQDTFTDSSELSSWDQERRLELVAWNTTYTGGFRKYTSSNDVVTPEIERITGVRLDSENSFDNGGVTADVAFNNIMITGLPDIAYGTNWIDPEMVYDLTDLIKEYCPTIMERMPDSVWNAENINGGQAGKVYAVPCYLGNVGLSAVDSEADPSETVMFEFQYNQYPYILVREDILQDAYPNAYSQEDLNEFYADQGGFTEEQLFDVPITSADQFRNEFLPKIYDAIHADEYYKVNSERWITPMLAGSGSDRDTWDFLGCLLPGLLGATGNFLNTGLTYWDASRQLCDLMCTQDFFKAELKEWVDLIAEGKYLDNYGIINNNQTVQAELNQGLYAIAYPPNCVPNGNVATYKGESVRYRKVYLKIEQDTERFEYFTLADPAPYGVSIFKDSVRESDLPQILRWLDFQCSELCDKLVAWGPRTAGLFTETTEADGTVTRRYKDETLADQMVYTTATLGSEVQKYNLMNGTVDPANMVFTFFYVGGSKDHPKCSYNLSSLTDLIDRYYAPSAVLEGSAEKEVYIKLSAEMWRWTDANLEGVERLWGRRNTLERALQDVLVSGAGFETAWQNMLNTATSIGWTSEYFNGPFTEAFLNINIDYLENFYREG